jgi:adenylate kinase family enzyme
MRYRQADLVLYFNYPKSICYKRVFKRLFNKNPEIDDRADGCREKVRLDLLRYMWNFEKRITDKIKNLQNKYPEIKFVEIKSDNDLAKLYSTQITNNCNHSHSIVPGGFEV